MKPSVHPFQTDDPRLRSIHEKVLAAQELALDDVTALFDSKDILAIGWLANYVRERMHGDATTYRVDSIALAAATQTLPILAQVENFGFNVAEFLVLGSEVDRVCTAAQALKKNWADVPVAAMTVEQIVGTRAKEVIQRLRDAGVDSLFGSGAEVFLPSLRTKLWQAASTVEQRAQTRGLAVAAGIKVPAYTVQRAATPQQQAHELVSLREVPSDAYSSLSFDPDASTSLNLAASTGMQEMKQIAVARLALAHVPHIRAYWQMLGGKLVQIAARFGASYLDGTALGASEAPEARARELAREIQVAGREPLEVRLSRRIVLVAN